MLQYLKVKTTGIWTHLIKKDVTYIRKYLLVGRNVGISKRIVILDYVVARFLAEQLD